MKDFADIKQKPVSILNEVKSSNITEPLTINVNRYFTNVDGTIVDKSTVPADLQVSYPYYLFGAFDQRGAYSIANKIVPPLGGAKYMYSTIVRSAYDFLEFTGANNVKVNFNIGDMIFLYTDDLNAPNYFIWVRVSCPFQSYASVMKNTANKFLESHEVLFFVDNTDNYNQTIFDVLNTPVGTYKVRTLNPYAYQSPDLPNAEFIRLLVILKITQYWGWYSYFTFNSELLSFNLSLKYQ